jgi:hypothetical protein
VAVLRPVSEAGQHQQGRVRIMAEGWILA